VHVGLTVAAASHLLNAVRYAGPQNCCCFETPSTVLVTTDELHRLCRVCGYRGRDSLLAAADTATSVALRKDGNLCCRLPCHEAGVGPSWLRKGEAAQRGLRLLLDLRLLCVAACPTASRPLACKHNKQQLTVCSPAIKMRDWLQLLCKRVEFMSLLVHV
jgi:hypothetical protein